MLIQGKGISSHQVKEAGRKNGPLHMFNKSFVKYDTNLPTGRYYGSPE